MTPSAVDKLYREHGHVVLRRARALLGAEAEARDVLQDIFVSLLQQPGQLAGVTRITAWLYRVTTHHCLNQLRNRRGRSRILGALAPPSLAAARSEQLAEVRSLLARLPEPLAEVAVFHHVDGMTYDEIAEVLECSRRHVGYLLQQLREIASSEASMSVAGPLWPTEQES